MRITNLEIRNFRGIDYQKIDLSSKINLFFGINGSGKSSVLDAVAISLSWLIEGVEKIEFKGKYIPDDSIKIGKDYASIQLTTEDADKVYQWENVDFRKGYPANKKSNFRQLQKLVYEVQKSYKNNHQLPIVVYYPTNRIAKGLSKDVSAKKSFSQLDVYENTLGSYANFETFFEWFRLQDDIINEHSTSRAKWMRENKEWIYLNFTNITVNLNKNNEEDRFIGILKEDTFWLEEPRFIFYELLRFYEGDKNQDEAEYLLHRIGRLLSIDDKEHILHEVMKIYSTIVEFTKPKKIFNDNELIFFWNVFLFLVQLSFWNLSQKGRVNIKDTLNKYTPFKKVTRYTTNEFFEIKVLFYELSKILEKDKQKLEYALDHKDRELKSVTNAIEKFIPEYQNLRVTRIPTPRMLIDKNGKTLSLNQLSDGEKNMIAMVGDIARRLAMANPKLPNPLEGNGIVLIDEIDLHLHPSWQRVIISKLTEVFPNCQFIVTTHSPQVIGEVHHENIFAIKDGAFSKLRQSIGLSSSDILEREMGTSSINENVKLKIDEICNLIDDENFTLAKEKIRTLEEEIHGDIPDTARMTSLITMLE